MPKTLVVSFYGGPGTGKSTMTAHVFALLKWAGVNCEMSLEYAKRKVWEKSSHVLADQVYVFGKQYHTQRDLEGQVDVVLTDSPLLMSKIYNSEFGENLDNLVLQQHRQFNNANIFLKRVKPYNPSGRLQTEDQAKEIDDNVKALLVSLGESYVEFDGSEEQAPIIAKYILEKLK